VSFLTDLLDLERLGEGRKASSENYHEQEDMDRITAAIYILSTLLALGYVVPLIFYGVGLRRLIRFSPAADRSSNGTSSRRPFVSVVIAARNEEATLGACLDSLLASTYPANLFEVLVVDDGSTDRTHSVAERYAVQRESGVSVRIISADNPSGERSRSGDKKAALATGILEARGNILVLTDADCVAPVDWLDLMIRTFDSDTGFVVGPVAFSYHQSAFSKTVALEFAGLAGIAAGSIGMGTPVSCSGASIAFRREAYTEVGGYTGLGHLASGDDELLMHRIDAETNWAIRYCAHSEATVVTRSVDSVGSFLMQRRRWASKVGRYENRVVSLVLVFVYLFVLSLPLVVFARAPR